MNTNRKMRTDSDVQEFRAELAKVQSKLQCTRGRAYEVLSKQSGKWWSGLAPNTLTNYATDGTLRSKRTYHRRRLARTGHTVTVRDRRSPVPPGTAALTVTEICKVIQLMRQEGIAIDFS